MLIHALVVLLIAIWHPCHCFPEDLKPNLILSAKDTSDFAVFSGKGLQGERRGLLDVQEIKFIGNKVLISSRNSIHVVDRSSLKQTTGPIAYEQILRWYPQNDTKCEQKIGSFRSCQNYIRMMVPVTEDSILICGTNAGHPSCRDYEWNGEMFNYRYQNSQITKRYTVPRDDVISLAYKYSDGYLFSATRVDFSAIDPAISRTPVTDVNLGHMPRYPRQGAGVVGSNQPLQTLRTEDQSSKSRWLSDPHFVRMIEFSEKMFVFFREEAIEASDTTEKVVFARVAQVCMKDGGGSDDLLRGKWTSFFKARLNCSIPGDRPFYFNEIQDVTEPIDIDGITMVFATMTTPENSITGSAVCAFTMCDIARAMAGDYKEQSKSSWCWNRRATRPPSPPPTVCRRDYSNALSARTLQFINEHPIMSESVGAYNGRAGRRWSTDGSGPIFTSTGSRTRFTAIAVEPNVSGVGNVNVTVMYIGTRQGKLLKVVSDLFGTRKTIFSEEWDVYKPSECSRRFASTNGRSVPNDVASDGNNNRPDEKRVRKVTLMANSDVILVTFQHCVISVPKQLCWHYKCESSCAQSGNPYCGWDDGKCVRVTSRNRGYVTQDILNQTTYSESCPILDSGVITQSDPICIGSAGIAFPLVIGLVGTFTVVLLVFLIIIKCKGRRKCPAACLKRDPSFAMSNRDSMKDGNVEEEKTKRRLFTRKSRSDDYAPRVSVEPTSPIEPSVRSRHPRNEREKFPLNNLNNSSIKESDSKEIFVVKNLIQEGQDNLSGEDTTWSDDLFDSDRSISEIQVAAQTATYQQPLSGSNDTSHFNANNNRTIGIAHPMNHKPVKVSQIVKPTFVSKPPSKIKMGAQYTAESYGATQSNATDSSHSNRGTLSRIVTNPNYLPVTPFVQRNNITSTNEPTNRVPLRTFSPVKDETPGDKRKVFPDDSGSFDLNFPPPPDCVLSPSPKVACPNMESFSTAAPVSSSWYPSPPNRVVKPPVLKAEANELTPLTESSKPLLQQSERRRSSTAKHSVISSSASGDSSSSGFVSSSLVSPQASFKDKSGAERKALIVAKGILSAQTFLSPKTNKKIKKKKSKENEKSGVTENIYDEVFEESSPDSQDQSRNQFSKRISECIDENHEVSFRSPEFYHSSDDEFDDPDNWPQTPADNLTPTPDDESKSSRSKKSIKLFRSKKSKKSKKDKLEGLRMQNEETFISPSYDEEPFVPTVVGWEEIEYPSSFQDDNTPTGMSSFHPGRKAVNSTMIGRSYDDTCLRLNGESDCDQHRGKQYDFYTMRPKNRMRQRMPKMRNTDKEWALTNNPLPVPTPAVPDII